MKLVNIRKGFATNSSSVHSVIIGTSERDNYDQEFGWKRFVCSSPEAKRAYFAQQLYENLKTYDMTDEEKQEQYHRVLSVFPELVMSFNEMENGYVDHQSEFCVPKCRTGEYAVDFFKDLASYYINGDFTIVGGNDNDGDDEENSISFLMEPESGNWLCRKEPWGYILLHKGSGTKLKFTNSMESFTGKSSTPELIDMKITNFCDNKRDCAKWCYQGSHGKGKSASSWGNNSVNSYLEKCAEAGVFEVAFGGGETTYGYILTSCIVRCHELGIIPNFSTASLEWLLNRDFKQIIRDKVGGFAYSIQDPSEVKTLMNYKNGLFRIADIDHKASFQYNLNAFPLENFKKIVDEMKEHCEYYPRTTLTLLGWKPCGVPEPYHHKGWLEYAQKAGIKLSIDTLIANQYQEELKDIDQRTYYTEEGKHSMYVDAVEHKCGASSYGKLEDCASDNFLNKFSKY